MKTIARLELKNQQNGQKINRIFNNLIILYKVPPLASQHQEGAWRRRPHRGAGLKKNQNFIIKILKSIPKRSILLFKP